MQVYNENVHDLLNSEPTNIKIQHDPKLGTVLTGVQEKIVISAQQVSTTLHYRYPPPALCSNRCVILDAKLSCLLLTHNLLPDSIL